MITWMQTHRKWLIITIWIATIAFVGAGFVGWGAYSYGKKQDTVAKVKDTEISVNDVQIIYNQLFNYYNQMTGGKLDQATADKFGLKKAAFQKALKNAVLIQFAKDNGIYITKKEVKEYLKSIPYYQKEGKITLTKTQLSQIKQELMISRISDSLHMPAKKVTIETIASALLMEDKIKINIIKAPDVEISEEEIKKFWENNKYKYKSQISYDINYYYVPLNAKITEAELHNYYDNYKQNYTDKNGKIVSFEKAKEDVKRDLLASKTKRDAIITMKKLKNNEIKFKTLKEVTLINQYLDISLMKNLIQKKFLKPVLTKKGWLIAKLLETHKPKILSYEKAKQFAKADLIKEKKKNKLIQIAKNKLTKFNNGIDLGFIGIDDTKKIADKLKISLNNANIFISALFKSQKPKDYVLLNNQNIAILYKIEEQKLLNKHRLEKYKENITISTNQLKKDTLEKSLIQQLLKLYESDIKVYMKI
jgi:peptidyl-prolyl cis-trans isomerase D